MSGQIIIPGDSGEVSDGFHTFNELYEHRCLLFLLLAERFPDLAWASKLHDDGTMFDGWFIAGIDLPTGVITYHLPIRMWELFREGKVLERAPKWDGHTPQDVCDRMRSYLQR